VAGEGLLDTPETDAANTGIPTGVPATQRMDRSLIHSVAWNAAGDWISQIFSWASFLVVTRLLAPSDFGMVAMASTIGPFVQYFSGAGIPRAIVTLRHLTDDDLAQLNSVGLLLGLASFAAAILLALPLAHFYRTPQLALVLVVSCIGLVANGAQTVSNGLLTKAMRFRELSLYAAIGALVAAAATLLFAWAGLGYWALILGNLLAGIVRTVLVMNTRRQTYAFPRWERVWEPLRFSLHVIVSLIALSLYGNLDCFTVGRVLGQTPLGFYSLAMTLAYVPLDKVTTLVTLVIPSYLAAVQHDLAAVRRYLRLLTENLALLTFPACIGLGMVARELIPLALGQKWAGVVGPLEVLSIFAALRSIVALLPKVLTAVGNPRYVMWNDLRAIAIMGPAFYVGSRWGISGVAWAWVAAYPFVLLPLYRKTLATIEMNGGEYVRSLRPAVEGTLVMVAAVACLKYVLPHSMLPAVRLVLEVLLGMASYAATLWMMHRERMLSLLRMAKNFWQQRRS
jgi:teichuronic acid exporter